jgi:hypothetical protein
MIEDTDVLGLASFEEPEKRVVMRALFERVPDAERPSVVFHFIKTAALLEMSMGARG